jgi:hypothetical protein
MDLADAAVELERSVSMAKVQLASVSVFNGLRTDTRSAKCPAGYSPDCSDMMFTTGGTQTRYPFRTLATLPEAITYRKEFTCKNGTVQVLALGLSGNLYVVAANGATTIIDTVAPGSLCNSVTAYGREYMNFFNASGGCDAPRQWDGRFCDRVSQGGPAVAPTVASVALPSSIMAAVGNTLTRQNNQVLCQTATAHGLQVGYQAQISNVPDSNATSVVQSNNSSVQNSVGGYWSHVATQWRSNFNPGLSPLSAFQALGFGFTIPAAATILGVVVELEINSQSSTAGVVAQVALWRGGAQVGTAKTPNTPITTTPTYTPYGSAGDLWGGALTPAIVNDLSFGFAVSCNCDSIRVFMDFPFTIQVYYTLAGSGTVAFIQSIVIDNEAFPGLALVTTNGPHGLIPNINVSIVGVGPGSVANISQASWSSGVTTLTTSTGHNLTPGSVVQVAGVTTSSSGTSFSFNGTFTVDKVPSPNQLSYVQVPITGTDPDYIVSSANTGAITISWPIPDDTPSPTYFEVQSCPTPTTFYIAVSYTNGTWTSGTVGFVWEGTFYVTSVPTATSFYYRQYGPNGATTASGTVTPFGQAAPGLHQVAQAFLTRSGFLTGLSPFAPFIANGGQYLQVSGLSIGGANVVARVLVFTGANGSKFFYIPTIPQVNGTVVGTATQINDNTTVSVLLDFADTTLFQGLGVDIPGNNLFAQTYLNLPSGVIWYQNRLFWKGEKNTVVGLLNMDMAGGTASPTSTIPQGWTASGTAVVSQVGTMPALTVTGPDDGLISQSAYSTAAGATLIQPLLNYSLRMWVFGGSAGTVVATLSSVMTGFSSVATYNLSGSPQSGYVTFAFSNTMPATIPNDLMYSVQINGLPSGSKATYRDLQLIYADNPNRNPIFRASYSINPEAYDSNTGNTGPADDNTDLRSSFLLQESLYCLTEHSLYTVESIGNAEPSSWSWSRIADKCGSFNANSVATGKGWATWGGENGAFWYSGGLPEKTSSIITSSNPNRVSWTSFASITNIFVDDGREMAYFGMVDALGNQTILMYDFHELSLGGSGKWCSWNRSANWISYSAAGTVFTIGSSFYRLDTVSDIQDDTLGMIGGYYTLAPLAATIFEKDYEGFGLRIDGLGVLTPLLYNKKTSLPPKILNGQELSTLVDTVAEWPANVSGRLLYVKLGQPGVRFSLTDVGVLYQNNPNGTFAGLR